MKKIIILKNIFLIVFLIVFFSNLSFASVQIFSNYNTNIKLNDDDTISIEKKISLQNIYEVGIVPGQIEFKINNQNNKIRILNYSSFDKLNPKIPTKLIKTKNFETLILDLSKPILPGFKYKFFLNYNLSFKPKGIIYKNILIPLKEDSRPIKNGKVILEIPNKYTITSISYLDNSTIINENKIIWELNSKTPTFVEIEYSYIPFSFKNYKLSTIFLIIINLILLELFIINIKKQLRKVKR